MNTTIKTVETLGGEFDMNISNEYPINEMSTEEYFFKAKDIINDKLFKPAGHNLDATAWNLQVSLGYAPNTRANGKTLGSCWSTEASQDGKTKTIFIHPCQLDNSTPEKIAEAIGIFTHELVHYVLETGVGHKPEFANLGSDVLLEGKPKQMTFGEKGTQWAIENIVSEMGRFRFEKFTGKPKTQTTRNVKVWCSDCDFKFNTSRKQIAEIQIFDCLTGCGGTLQHDQELSE